MDMRTKDEGHEGSGAWQTISAHADLIACVVEGAIARNRNIDSSQNPHLAALGNDTMNGSERNGHLRRADAWWDGWEELNLVMQAAVASIDDGAGEKTAAGTVPSVPVR